MVKNKNIILIVVIIALALIAWGLSRAGSLDDKITGPKVRYSSSVNKMEIVQSGLTTILIKEGDVWFVQKEDGNYPANHLVLEEIVKTLGDLSIGEIVSQNSENNEDFNLDDASAVKITWFKGDKQLGQLFLGQADYGRQGDYVRMGEKAEVYITKGHIRPQLVKSEYRDLVVIKIEQDAIKQVAWHYGEAGENFKVIKKMAVDTSLKEEGEGELAEGSGETGEESTPKLSEAKDAVSWFLQKENVEKELDNFLVNPLLSEISSLKASNIFIKEGAKDSKDYGFTNPLVQVTITDSKDQDYILTIGDQAEPESGYYALIAGRDKWVYLLDTAVVEQYLTKKSEDFSQPAEE